MAKVKIEQIIGFVNNSYWSVALDDFSVCEGKEFVMVKAGQEFELDMDAEIILGHIPSGRYFAVSPVRFVYGVMTKTNEVYSLSSANRTFEWLEYLIENVEGFSGEPAREAITRLRTNNDNAYKYELANLREEKKELDDRLAVINKHYSSVKAKLGRLYGLNNEAESCK